jgi:D-3-phosphoglycerate dehydrogenase
MHSSCRAYHGTYLCFDKASRLVCCNIVEVDSLRLIGSALEGKWLGVIGLGRIGREVSRRAKGLGMKVSAFDPYASEETAKSLGISLEPLEVVFNKSDFVTLHVPLIETTRNMVNRELLSKMKPDARLLNVARGGLIDEEALLEWLDSGRLAGAGIDCFVTEPPSKIPNSTSERLSKHPKVVATPHLGASTVEVLCLCTAYKSSSVTFLSGSVGYCC